MMRRDRIGHALAPAAATALLLGAAPAMAQKGVGAGFVGSPGVTFGGGGGFRGGGFGGGGLRGAGFGGGLKGVGPNYVGPPGVTTGGGGFVGRGGYGFDRPGYGGRGYGHYSRGYRGDGYGLGGYGLGLGLAGGGLYGAYGYPGSYGYDDGYSGYAPVGYAPAATEVETDDTSAACARRFRTYDPRTGTYVGKGGVRRACP